MVAVANTIGAGVLLPHALAEYSRTGDQFGHPHWLARSISVDLELRIREQFPRNKSV